MKNPRVEAKGIFNGSDANGTKLSRCEVRTKDLVALKEPLELSIQKSEENQTSHQMIF